MAPMNRENQVSDWFFTLGVALVTFLTLYLYGPVQGFSFLNFDDNLYIVDNPHVRSGLTFENVRWAFTEFHGGHWHPLSWISHMVDCEVFGLDPSGPHLVNSVIHALNASLFFLLIVNLIGNGWVALVGALFFALHPMRMEAVAWIVERKELCAALFGLLTLLSYLRFVQKPNLNRKLIVMGVFSVGLLFKPTLVVLPCLFLLLDFWPLERKESLRKLVFEKWPFFALSLLSSVVTIWAQKAGGGFRTLSEISGAERFSAIPVAYLSYLGKLVWPTGFGIFYPFQRYSPGLGAGAWLALGLVSVVCIQNRKKFPQLLFGWSWFVISLATVVGFVQVGGQSVADRWTYLSHMGLILALCGLWAQLSTRVQRFVSVPALVSLGICFSITSKELPHWKDSIAIFKRTLEASPDNFMAHTNLGQALSSEGRLEEAAFHFEEAVRLHPNYSVALNNLGFLRAKQGRYVEAKQLFTRALERNPNFPEAQQNLELIGRLKS